MSKCDFYRQCSLERKIENGVEKTTSWIPDVYAKVGDVIQLKQEDGTWINGWKVQTASEPLAAPIVEAMSRNYLKQRKASDIVFNDIKKQNELASKR